jgi:hypothetical protein
MIGLVAKNISLTCCLLSSFFRPVFGAEFLVANHALLFFSEKIFGLLADGVVLASKQHTTTARYFRVILKTHDIINVSRQTKACPSARRDDWRKQ